MKVKAWVQIEQEVEVEVSIADMLSSVDDAETLLSCINRAHSLLKNISDRQMRLLNPEQRKVVREAMHLQADRFLCEADVECVAQPT